MQRPAIMACLACLACLAGVATTARADTSWHAGVDLRIDQGAHPIRLAGGLQLDALDTTLVLDPMFWTDGQHDTDVFASWGRRWSLVGGWRTTAIAIAGGHQFQQKLLVGVGAPLPDLGPVRARWTFELATLLVKHGGDLPTDTISFASGRDFIDLVNFGMFVTFEYARPL